jgi:hypothetical protein
MKFGTNFKSIPNSILNFNSILHGCQGFFAKKKILDTIGFGGRFFLKQPTLPPSLLAAGVGLA